MRQPAFSSMLLLSNRFCAGKDPVFAAVHLRRHNPAHRPGRAKVPQTRQVCCQGVEHCVNRAVCVIAEVPCSCRCHTLCCQCRHGTLVLVGRQMLAAAAQMVPRQQYHLRDAFCGGAAVHCRPVGHARHLFHAAAASPHQRESMVAATSIGVHLRVHPVNSPGDSAVLALVADATVLKLQHRPVTPPVYVLRYEQPCGLYCDEW